MIWDKLDTIINKYVSTSLGQILKPIKVASKPTTYFYVIMSNSKVIGHLTSTLEKDKVKLCVGFRIKDSNKCSCGYIKKNTTEEQFGKLFKASIEYAIKKKSGKSEGYSFGFKFSDLDKFTQTYFIFSFSILLFSLVLLLYVIYRKAKVTAEELSASEKHLDNEVFKGHTGREPEFAIYQDLTDTTKYLVKSDKVNGILVYGPPGTGKTFMIRRTLYLNKIDYTVYRGGTAGLENFYQVLYDNKNKVVVLDDFDIPWTSQIVGFIKAATDTQKTRILTMPFANQSSNDSFSVRSYSSKFKFTGKLIIVTNKNENEIPQPVLSRVPHFRVAFNIEKMFKIIQSMMKYIEPDVSIKIKEEVLSFLKNAYKMKKLRRLDIRAFEIALSIRLAAPNSWKSIVVNSVIS